MTDFSALGFDPAPGDLATVEGFTDSLTVGCEGVEDALSMLDSDDDAAWVGKAAVAFRSAMSEDFRPHLVDTGEALRTSRDALSGWAGQLSLHQVRARSLAEEAAVAQAAVARCASAHDRAKSNADDEDADPDAVSDASRALGAAQGELEEIRQRAQRLKEAVDADAAAAAASLLAAGQILEVYHGNFLGDVLGDVGNWLADAGEWLMDNLVPILEDLLRAVLPIIGILALFIPVLGTVALIMSIALVVIDGLQALTGRGTWQDFLTGAASLALGVGVGKLAQTLLPKGDILIPNFNSMTTMTPGGAMAVTQAPPIAISLQIHLPNFVSNTYWTSKTLLDAKDKGTGFMDAVAEPWQNLGERVQNTFAGNGPRTDEELSG